MRVKNLSKGMLAFHNCDRTKKIQLPQGEVYEFKDAKEYKDFFPDMIHFQKDKLLELGESVAKAQPKPKLKSESKPKSKEVTLKGEGKKK